MCAEPITSFAHFVGIEETNLLTNMANLGEGFFLIHNLDILYVSCFDLKPLDTEIFKIPSFLYLVSHSEFYIGMISYLRMHQSKSFNSLRAALDSTFTAYYLLKYPDKTDVYLSKVREEDNPEWDKIFRSIKGTIKKDISKFPLAIGLPEIHEFCSIYAHSDALGILHRYNENIEKQRLEAKYFDYDVKSEDYNKWFGYLLFSFYRIFMIYWNEIFKLKAEKNARSIELNIIEYKKRIRAYVEKYTFNDSLPIE